MLDQFPGYQVLLSELTLVEMYSSILKKARTNQITKSEADKFIKVIADDFQDVLLNPINSFIISQAQKLILKYGMRGLRSLDAIQLASALSVKTTINYALTNDILLKQFLIEEGIKCDI